MKKLAYIIFIITLTITNCYSQGGFSKNYFFNTSLTSLITDAFETPIGNLILVGKTNDSLNGQNFNRLTVIGATANGTELWRKSYGNYKFQYLNNTFTSRAVITYSNCFYLYSAALDSNNKYFSVLIKFNFNGDTLWQKKYYDATDYLYIQSICKSVDNGFLMTGFFEGALETCLLIKTDSTGKELWRKKLNKGVTPDTQAGHRVIQDSVSKKIIIAGFQYQWDGTQPGGFSGYANIIVTDSLGIELQRKAYSGACGSGFYDLIQTRDKHFIAVGSNDQCDDMGGPGGTRRKKSFLIKINIANLTTPLWQKEFDVSSPINDITTILELGNGSLILGGVLDTLNSYNLPKKGMLRVIKLDKNGNLLWKKYLSRDNAQKNTKFPTGLNKCANGGFIFANQLLYLNKRPYNFTIIDSMGCDSTIAYCSTVGLQEINKNAKEIKLYPNPSNGILNIDLENVNAISTSSITNLNLKIINTLGQTILESKLEKTINISNLNNGIYFLQLFDKGNLIGTEKIIKE